MQGKPVVNSRTTHISRWGAGLVVGGICLWLSWRGLDVDAVRTALRQVQYGWLMGALACVVGVALLKGGRWWFLYPERHRPASWRRTFPVLMMAQMLNVLIPLRLGELTRIGLMAQGGVPIGATLSTIVIEKALDLLAVGLLLGILAPTTILPDWFPIHSGIEMGLTGAILLSGLVGLWLGRRQLKSLARKTLSCFHWLPERWRERLLRLAEETLEGLGALTTFEAALPVLGSTAVIWFVSILTMVCMLATFNLTTRWPVALVLSLAIYLGNLVPTPPALIGVIGAVTEVTLGWFGVSRGQATALGIVLNVVLISPLVLMGGIAAWLRFVNSAGGAWAERWKYSLGWRHEESR